MPNEVRLRDVTADDLPIFFEQQLDPDATRMAAFPPREQAAFMAHWHRILADAAILKQTILCDGQVAGNIVCYEAEGRRLVGYWLGRSFWGRGIATAALMAFLAGAGARPLFAYVTKHNLASLRVLRKCGFELYGEEGEELILRWGATDRNA